MTALSFIHEYDVIFKKIAVLDRGRAIVLIVLFYNIRHTQEQNSGFRFVMDLCVLFGKSVFPHFIYCHTIIVDAKYHADRNYNSSR